MLKGVPAGSTIGACGPAAMIGEVRAAFGSSPSQQSLVIDAPATSASDLPEIAEIVCAKSGRTFQADQHSSLLDQLNGHGVVVPSSCLQGICGTCEVEVRSGRVDHRDEVLTDEERAGNGYMLPCVSRPASRQLVLNV
ncbi:2Fe-2S iron-sulfur cluster-binding protein [Lentzea sp. JNUCC 0626]|uniref:2Fe-2S iron-sulfur cluster-binding protein n=1 Tax=Lentzea sp. JNUCC 0626 TaxID=3367513 RepID=UPI0037480A00